MRSAEATFLSFLRSVRPLDLVSRLSEASEKFSSKKRKIYVQKAEGYGSDLRGSLRPAGVTLLMFWRLLSPLELILRLPEAPGKTCPRGVGAAKCETPTPKAVDASQNPNA